MARVLRIATRKSPLALWQAEHVKAALGELYPELTIQLLPMSTRGDEILEHHAGRLVHEEDEAASCLKFAEQP